MSQLWITNAELDDRLVTCVITDGRVSDLAPGLRPPSPHLTELDAHGGALLPGLIDHHLHLYALAAAHSSLDLTGVTDLAEVTPPTGTGWVRAVGASRQFARADLDAHFGPRPVRVQHRSGALWTLSSAAIELLAHGLDAEERTTGNLWRADRRLRQLLTAADPDAGVPDLAGLGEQLVRFGLTRLTDATPDLDPTGLDVLRGRLPQQVNTLSAAVASDLPVKIVIGDHDLPGYDDLVTAIRTARERSRPVAVHAVTAAALALTISALDHVGVQPGDRIEHAAVCDDAGAHRLVELGVTVVTQPTLWQRRAAEFTAETPAPERPWLWRHGGLLRAGVPVAVSSDAPYGDPDPWATIHAAATRKGPERVAPADTIRTLLTTAIDPTGPPRGIQIGAPADLVVLNTPLDTALTELQTKPDSPIVATILGDRVYGSRTPRTQPV